MDGTVFAFTLAGSLAAELNFLPASAPAEKALIFCTSISLSVAVFSGIGAWQSVRRFTSMAIAAGLSIIFLAVLSIIASGTGAPAQEQASAPGPADSAGPRTPAGTSPAGGSPARAPGPGATPDPAPGPGSLLAMNPVYATTGVGSPSFGSGPQDVNGTRYQQTLYDTTSDSLCGDSITDSATYQLDHKYAQFRTTVGLADSSGNGDTATFTFLVDGQQEGPTPTLAPGQTMAVSLNVTNAFRVVLQESCTTANQFAGNTVTAVWISPAVTG